jgi:hypothetical protein
VVHVSAIPQTEALLSDAGFAFEIVKSRIILFEIILVPSDELMPFISPAVPAVELVVALVRFAMVLPLIVTLPVPALQIP